MQKLFPAFEPVAKNRAPGCSRRASYRLAEQVSAVVLEPGARRPGGGRSLTEAAGIVEDADAAACLGFVAGGVVGESPPPLPPARSAESWATLPPAALAT